MPSRPTKVTQVVDLESGLQVYVVGEPDGRPGVIWNYDIRGFNGGRWSFADNGNSL